MTDIDLGREGFITLGEATASLHAIVDASLRVTVASIGSGELALSESGGEVLVSLDGAPAFVLSPATFRGGWRTGSRSPDAPSWLLDLDTGQPLPAAWGTTVQVQVPENAPRA